jgi:hypothetical protein
MRLCYYCKYFTMIQEGPHYSEHTPGSSWMMYCDKNVWDFDTESDTLENFRQCLETAESCELFEDRGR